MDLGILRKRVAELFPGGYLTLIAIIQGVALGVLLNSVNSQVFSASTPLHRLTAAAQAFGVLAAIVIITHRYFLLTATVRWGPTVLDTFFPYALGVGEVSAALLIGNNAGWWAAVSVLFLAAVSSFAHTLARATDEMFGGLDLLRAQFRHAIKLQLRNCSVLAVLSGAIVPVTIYTTLPSAFYVATHGPSSRS